MSSRRLTCSEEHTHKKDNDQKKSGENSHAQSCQLNINREETSCDARSKKRNAYLTKYRNEIWEEE